MERKVVSGIMFTLLLISMLTLTFNIQPVKGWTGTVYIRADGSIDPLDAPIITYDNVTYTLTDNIISSADGIVVERNNIIIDGANYTVQGAGSATGIELIERRNVTVRNTNIRRFGYGIWLEGSLNNSIIGNIIANNSQYGIEIWWECSNNSIIGNSIVNNSWAGIEIGGGSGSNLFYHNNFIDNGEQVQSYGSENVWDNGYPSGGNYWSDYSGPDLHWGSDQNETGSDGIGDAAHQIDVDNIDRYPLMGPFNTFDAGTWNGIVYNVDVVSNSTVSDLQFDVDQKSVSFNVTGDDGTAGFCRVMIPKDLLWVEDGWTITIDDQVTNYRIIPNQNFTYLYFTYNHSTQTVTIQGTNVIPEFPSSITLFGLLMLITIPLIFFAKKKHYRKTKT